MHTRRPRSGGLLRCCDDAPALACTAESIPAKAVQARIIPAPRDPAARPADVTGRVRWAEGARAAGCGLPAQRPGHPHGRPGLGGLRPPQPGGGHTPPGRPRGRRRPPRGALLDAPVHAHPGGPHDRAHARPLRGCRHAGQQRARVPPGDADHGEPDGHGRLRHAPLRQVAPGVDARSRPQPLRLRVELRVPRGRGWDVRPPVPRGRVRRDLAPGPRAAPEPRERGARHGPADGGRRALPRAGPGATVLPLPRLPVRAHAAGRARALRGPPHPARSGGPCALARRGRDPLVPRRRR